MTLPLVKRIARMSAKFIPFLDAFWNYRNSGPEKNT